MAKPVHFCTEELIIVDISSYKRADMYKVENMLTCTHMYMYSRHMHLHVHIHVYQCTQYGTGSSEKLNQCV